MSYAIRVENLGKRYRLGQTHAGTVREVVNRAVGRILGRNRPAPAHNTPHPDGRDLEPDGGFWALRDVSFDVAPGEVVGIIGRNGSGKSTLLKILSQIAAPTTGRIRIRGRVASLLEVGTGFHHELSGRENVYLNGAILGMTKAEIRRKFDDIVAFAEVDQFIDTPVKRYSSGMYVRLAFAVAAHLEPEILIVDEVLAVGDASFQKKCLGKMGDVAREGRTVLFVSHDIAAVGRMCSMGLRLDKGILHYAGETRGAIEKYLSTAGTAASICDWSKSKHPPGDEYIQPLKAEILDPLGNPFENIYQEDDFIIRIVYRVLKPMRNTNVGFEIRAADGTVVLTSYDADHLDWCNRGRMPGIYSVECRIPGNFLNEGVFFLTFQAGIPFYKLCFKIRDAIQVVVNRAVSARNPIGRMKEHRKGLLAPNFEWNITSPELQ